MEMCARYVGGWLTSSVPFLDSTCILWPTESKQDGGTASLNITMMIFFVWNVQMQDFQKPKVKTVIIPHLLKIENERIINKLNYDIA